LVASQRRQSSSFVERPSVRLKYDRIFSRAAIA
jgi:hypothetical protein